MAINNKKSILSKTIQFGSSILLSRFLGIIRELLLIRFLPLGVMSDAFLRAYTIPNHFRKIFAEGALSAAFVPTIVEIEKKGNKKDINSLMTLSFIIFEGSLLLMCIFTLLFPKFVIWIFASGFSKEQIEYSASLLRILIFLILFLSSSSLLAGALQAVHHFFVTAFGPVLLNICFVLSLLLCLHFNMSVQFLCYAILFGGLVQFLLHLFVYFKLNFGFSSINDTTWINFRLLLKRFLPMLFTMSIMELVLLFDENFSSYLPPASLSLIYYAQRFMGIPLSIIGTCFSTVLLPHFARISAYAPSRISFYLYESLKLVFWVTVPVTVLMSFFSDKIFLTLFSDKFTMAKIIESHYILIAFLIGLFFFSMNKILISAFYGLRNVYVPTVVSLISAITNIGLNYILMPYYKTVGLAVAMTLSIGVLQTILLFTILLKKYNFTIYPKHLIKFLIKCIFQLTVGLICFFLIYYYLESFIRTLPEGTANALLNKVYFWLWIGPLCLFLFLGLYKSKKLFGIKFYFVD